jgi:hypothetical protein
MTLTKVTVETDSGDDVVVDDLPREITLYLQRDGVVSAGQHLGRIKIRITPDKDSNSVEFYVVSDLGGGIKVIPEASNVFSIEIPERS